MDLVTIAIPAYNCQEYIDYAVQSVINQTYKNWELLLLDDGSTDGTLQKLKAYETDDRIRIISDGQNRGLIYRLNQSINLAHGRYYARMDADDIMLIHRIQSQIDFLTKNPTVDVVGSCAYTIDGHNNIKELIEYPLSPTPKPNQLCFLHPSVMGRIDWFRRNRYNQLFNRMEDVELWFRAANNSTYKNLDIPLMFYRESGMPLAKKYIATQRSALRLAINGSKYGIGHYESLKYGVSTIIKIVVCFVLSAIGRTDLQIKLRRRKTTSFDFDKAVLELQQSISAY